MCEGQCGINNSMRQDHPSAEASRTHICGWNQFRSLGAAVYNVLMLQLGSICNFHFGTRARAIGVARCAAGSIHVLHGARFAIMNTRNSARYCVFDNVGKYKTPSRTPNYPHNSWQCAERTIYEELEDPCFEVSSCCQTERCVNNGLSKHTTYICIYTCM